LGIVYDPPVPLDQSVAEIDDALGTLPEDLTGMESSFDDTSRNLGLTADSIDQIAENLELISLDLDTTSEILVDYVDLVGRAIKQVRLVRRDIRQKVNSTRLVLSGILVWLALSQAAPLYLGCSLVFTPAEPVAVTAGQQEEEPEDDNNLDDLEPDGDERNGQPEAR
jgi:ABC-type transporter Mla subunit MlaD